MFYTTHTIYAYKFSTVKRLNTFIRQPLYAKLKIPLKQDMKRNIRTRRRIPKKKRKNERKRKGSFERTKGRKRSARDRFWPIIRAQPTARPFSRYSWARRRIDAPAERTFFGIQQVRERRDVRISDLDVSRWRTKARPSFCDRSIAAKTRPVGDLLKCQRIQYRNFLAK